MILIPKKAATVILLREGKPGGFEIFLLKRHEKSSFMGGNFVYPGGRVDRDDGSYETCSLCSGVTSERAFQTFGKTLPPDECLAHWVAGIRELFEEAGVLLAYDQQGKSLHLTNPTDRERFLSYRDLLHEGKMSICQLAQEEKLLFALDQLHYYAHWITPEAQSQRFDTRFFLAFHPAGQEASHDQTETTIGVWLSPREALEKNSGGEVALSPPTLKTLEDLSRFKKMDEVFASLKTKLIRPILPVLTKAMDETLILFPWDPEYDIFKKGETPKQTDHGRPSRPEDNTTRVILRKGLWMPYCRTKEGSGDGEIG
jgi:8-oxo-dGTP pyrophosphatase MutT (NUDIX family)